MAGIISLISFPNDQSTRDLRQQQKLSNIKGVVLIMCFNIKRSPNPIISKAFTYNCLEKCATNVTFHQQEDSANCSQNLHHELDIHLQYKKVCVMNEKLQLTILFLSNRITVRSPYAIVLVRWSSSVLLISPLMFCLHCQRVCL